MKESFEDTLHNITFNQLDKARNMGRQILQSLESGNIHEDLAFNLLNQVRDQIIDAYDLNIEFARSMNKQYERIVDSKKHELYSFDEAINKYTSKKRESEELSPEEKETLESLLK